MLKTSNIDLIMDTLYGEEQGSSSLNSEDEEELIELQSQLNFLDEWHLDDDLNLDEKNILTNNEILDIKEVASYLRLSEAEVVSLLPQMPHIFLAGKYRFQLESVKAWLSSIETNPLKSNEPNTNKNNIVHLQDFLVRNVI